METGPGLRVLQSQRISGRSDPQFPATEEPGQGCGKSSRLLRHKWCIYFLIAVTKVLREQKLILANGFRVQPILVGKVGCTRLVVVAEWLVQHLAMHSETRFEPEVASTFSPLCFPPFHVGSTSQRLCNCYKHCCQLGTRCS